MSGPYNKGRIRLQLGLGAPSDQLTGTTPSISVNTGLQFELSDIFQGVLIDASQLASVTLQVRLSSNEDSSALMTGTVMPSSTGWNSNPANVAGNQLIPSYATYSSAGTGATVTATISGGAVNGFTGLSGGSGYTVAPIVFFVGGGGSGASAIANLTGGVVTSLTIISGGNPSTPYTSAPTVLLTPPPSSYVLGVQQGAIYNWTIGENDLTVTNGATLVTASNLVPSGAAYSAGSYSLTGLTANGYYQWIKGANDTSVDTIAAPPGGFFLANGSDVLAGTGTSTVTAQVYPAEVGANIISSSLYYGATSLVSSGTPAGAFSSTAPNTTAATNYTGGIVYLVGLTPGATYAYSLGANDASINGVSAATALTGTFTPTTSFVTLTTALTGTPTITAKIYTTTQSASTLIISGLTQGVTYYFTKGANETSLNYGGNNAALTNSGFFTALSSSCVLTGTGSAQVTATLVPVTPVENGSFVAQSNTVTFTGTPGASVTASLTGNVGWQQTTDQLCIIPFTASQTQLYTPPGGGTTAYWLLVMAVTTSGVSLVLGAGPINAVDYGQASGTTPISNNIAVYPKVGGIGLSAASYDGSGNVTLTLTAGFNYYWSPGSATDTGAAGTLSASAFTFTAAASTVVLTGTAGQPVGATVYAVNTRPLDMILPLTTANTTGFTVSGLTLSFTPMSAEATIMIPVSGQQITAWLTYSSLSTSGATWTISSPIPANTGYAAAITFK